MGVQTSSRRYLWRLRLDSKMAAPEMTSTKTLGEFFDPYRGGGGKWRPSRFRPPSWMISFPGSGNEVIQDGGRKRKGRHFPPPPQWGSKNSPYTTHGIPKKDIDLYWRGIVFKVSVHMSSMWVWYLTIFFTHGDRIVDYSRWSKSLIDLMRLEGSQVYGRGT